MGEELDVAGGGSQELGGCSVIKRVLILVEGQSAYRFVKDILCPFYDNRGIYLNPTINPTRRVLAGPDFKGGITKYSPFRKQLQNLLRDKQATVTTFIDYYGLPQDFPGMRDCPLGSPQVQVEHVQNAVRKDLCSPTNFLPFVMLHEFEAMLFTSADVLPKILSATDEEKQKFSAICNQFAPEEINQELESSPSHRINKIFRTYSKVLHGSAALEQIGLCTIKSRCPHLSSWLEQLAA